MNGTLIIIATVCREADNKGDRRSSIRLKRQEKRKNGNPVAIARSRQDQLNRRTKASGIAQGAVWNSMVITLEESRSDAIGPELSHRDIGLRLLPVIAGC